MQSRLYVILPSCFFAIILSGCSGGGFTLPPAATCSTNFLAAGGTPLPIVAVPGQTKLSMAAKDPANANLLPPGKYTYKTGTLFFKENTATRPFLVEVQDQADVNGASTKQVGVCMRNSRTLSGILAQTDGVTDMVVGADGSQKVFLRNFAYNADLKDPLVVSPKSADSKPSAGDGYPDDKIAAKIMLKNNATDFEIRSQVDTPTGSYYLSVHMAYSACPGNVCP